VASQLDQLVSGSVSWISLCFFEFCLAFFFFLVKSFVGF
jgi:hypothetical protein